MICTNCGAHFDDQLPKCPYCGAFHYEGAKKEYMGKLEDLKEDLDELHETVPEMYTTELKNQGKRVRKILLIIAAIFAAFILLFMVSSFLLDSSFSRNEKEVLLFTKEAYPIMDAYYEAEDFDGMLSFYYDSIQNNENADFYSWEHYSFLMCYENMEIFRESAARLGSDTFDDYDMHELFYCYLSSRFYQKGYPMDEKDQMLAATMEDEMEGIIDTLHLTDKELTKLNNLLSSPEYPSWDDIEEFSKEIYERLY